MKTRNSKLKKSLLFLALFAIVFAFSSCAKSADIDACTANDPYGFWSGLWHGIIAPISFFGSLIYDDIAMYAVNNNGGWYDFGFVLGAGILFGGGSRASKK